MDTLETIAVHYQPFDCRPKIRFVRPDAGDGPQSGEKQKKKSEVKREAKQKSKQYEQDILACDSISQVISCVSKAQTQQQQEDDAVSLSMVLASISDTSQNELKNNQGKLSKSRKLKKQAKEAFRGCLRPQMLV